MPESYANYRTRLLGYLGDRDPIHVQRRTPTVLTRLIAGKSRRVLARRPRRGQWSVTEVLAHMADAELAMGWRLRNMLATPGVTLSWWDQDLWARRTGYITSVPKASLDLFGTLRRGNLTLLTSVPRRRWRECYGMHELRGRQTVWDFVVMEAAHDLAHVRQIKRALAPVARG